MVKNDILEKNSTNALDTAERILEVTLTLGELIAAISRALFILRQKRRTLEEKAIARYLHRAAHLLGLMAAGLHELLEQGGEQRVDCNQLEQLSTTATDLKQRVDELLKILHFNLNFLEQYFEYDFFAKLSNESNVIEQLTCINQNLITADRLSDQLNHSNHTT